MFKYLKSLVRDSKFEPAIRCVLDRTKVDFESSPTYWESRYRASGTSGAGSYGRLAKFKADVLNKFVSQNSIKSVIEFGSGDGNQLTLAEYPNYIGVDVSSTAISWSIKKFKADSSKIFLHSSEYTGQKAELTLSLDVLYHLIEDKIFQKYMSDLFEATHKYVIVYSSDYVNSDYDASHVRHRRFTDWVESNQTDFHLIKKLPNIYPYEETDPDNTSLSDFYFFERVASTPRIDSYLLPHSLNNHK
jgi:hypothetical protein